MRLAADRDLVARQYANGYADVFDVVLPALAAALADGPSAGDGDRRRSPFDAFARSPTP